MRSIIFIAAALLLPSCKETECGDGTIARDGKCEPSDTTIDTAKCGENTVAVGDQCVPKFDPTVCDPATTAEDLDTSTNVITCVGTGGGGCGSPIACPQPTPGKQTICGQIYTIEDNEFFAAADSSGVRCDPAAPAASGPCAVRINPYDALAFASNPGTTPLAVADTYIDDCGRFRLTDVTLPAAPFIALGMDDISPTAMGPGGVTNAAGVALPVAAGMASKDTELFAVPSATTTKWAMTGGPTIAGGIYVMMFRQKRAPSRLTQAGVVVLKLTNQMPPPAPTPGTDHYFVATDVQRERVDAGQTMTGANGTALVTNVAVTDAYTGTGGLPAECRFSAHVAATVAGVVFVQILRPVNATGMTCNL